MFSQTGEHGDVRISYIQHPCFAGLEPPSTRKATSDTVVAHLEPRVDFWSCRFVAKTLDPGFTKQTESADTSVSSFISFQKNDPNEALWKSFRLETSPSLSAQS